MNNKHINALSFLIALVIHAGLLLFVSPKLQSRHYVPPQTLNLCLQTDISASDAPPKTKKALPVPKKKNSSVPSKKKKPPRNKKANEQMKPAVTEQEVVHHETGQTSDVSNSPSPSARASVISSYLSVIRSKIEHNKYYPRFSKRQHQEGTSIIKLLIAPDGTVLKITLVSSSGHKTLDKAALDAVRKSVPLPPPSGYGLGKISLDIPLCYLLR